MTNKVKAQGLVPDRKNCWEFFIKLIRKNLHVVLAFSPVGDDFRNRAKKFPALVNCTVIGEQNNLPVYVPTGACPPNAYQVCTMYINILSRVIEASHAACKHDF